MKICVMTLGCKVNKYESDSLIYNLELKGYQATDKLEFADFYIINTCAVTQEAEKKSRQMIARCRKFNPSAKIIICGCASQNNNIQFRERGVSCITGTSNKIKISKYIDKLVKNDKIFINKPIKINKLPLKYEDDLIAKQTRTRAYIKIQDGCNNFCSYCIIPYLRGRSRSRPIFSILNEAAMLNNDVKEIVLTGINVTDYKIDGKPSLLTLLEELDTYGKRLRLSSIEESIMSEEFIKGLKSLNNFCPHFHLSLQSGSNSVLKRMNRHYTSEEFFKSIILLKKYFPYAGITTDVIVGFPEESDEEFEESYNFIKKCNFSFIHVFQYSNRDGTSASKIYKDLTPQIKQKRSAKLLQLSEELHNNFIVKNKNKIVEILVEEKVDNYFVGYSKNYIKSYIESKTDIIGKIIKGKIIGGFKDGALVKHIKIL